jgi:membrane associated rhomboid family serine protease
MQDFRPRSFNVLPDVIKNLLIINGLLFLATLTAESFGVQLSRILGLHYVNSQYFHPYQFVSHLFMHGNFMHLFSNMFALWMFGSTLENVWGPKKFLFFYLFTGLGAAFIHSGVLYYENTSLEAALNVFLSAPTPDAFKFFIDEKAAGFFNNNIYDFINEWSKLPDNDMFISQAKVYANSVAQAGIDVPTVGASGAVFGVLLAFGMLFPNTLLYIYFLFPIKAKYFVALYAMFEFYTGYQNLTGNGSSNIAHFAHLGGMLFAFILIKYWQKDKRNFY